MNRMLQGGPAWRPPEDDDLMPDLTPMLDVLFMLLVFFLLTANSVEHALSVSLPDKEAAAARPIEEDRRLRIVLPARPGEWTVDGRTLVDWDSVKRAILDRAGVRRDAPVIIEGDRRTPLDRVMQVFGFLSANGFTRVDVLMERAAGAPGGNR